MENKINLNKIYPWIKKFEGNLETNSFEVIANDGTKVEISLPYHQLMADLGVMYVVDNKDFFNIVDYNMLPDDIDESTLYEYACNNLRRDIEFRIVNTNWGGAGIVAGGNFEAASLCCPDIWEYVASQYKENFVVAVPARDVVIMAPLSDKDIMHNLKVTVNKIITSGDHILTDNLFYYNIETKSFSVYEK